MGIRTRTHFAAHDFSNAGPFARCWLGELRIVRLGQRTAGSVQPPVCDFPPLLRTLQTGFFSHAHEEIA
jgi:hypothetical protein